MMTNQYDEYDYDTAYDDSKAGDIGGSESQEFPEAVNGVLAEDYTNRKIPASFDCSGIDLTSLKGCPKKVKRSFYCGSNELLTSLEGCPDVTGKDFSIIYTGITSLKGIGEDYCLSIGKGLCIDNSISSGILDVLKIKNLKVVYSFELKGDLLKAINIINNYLVPGPDLRNIEKCKAELEESGLSKFC